MTTLNPLRYFSGDAAQKQLAFSIYEPAARLPLVCPHGHVDPALFASEAYRFNSPVDLLIIPDHYVFRMLYSQGIQLESLGIQRRDGGAVESDHRKIWQLFADNFHLFRGTPTSLWLREELSLVFGIDEPLNTTSAQRIYDQIAARLGATDFTPRKLYDQFNIEVLATTDAATDTLHAHQAVADSAWQGRIIPTFRPDALTNIDHPMWLSNIAALGAAIGKDVSGYKVYIDALQTRRAYFVEHGATATDHGVLYPYTEALRAPDAEAIFERALRGTATSNDAQRFTAHMVQEMARMSIDDGLVMQLHVGSFRNHNADVFAAFGADKGADMPVAMTFTQALQPLLNRFGNHPSFRLLLFTLDESTYSRELAPLAGHYPSVRLGPPWWFFDSLNGMRRYFDAVVETAGIYNTAGFNDDTRAFLSIPARHDMWRRASADWLATLVRGYIISETEAHEMMTDMAYNLAKRAYRIVD